MSVEYRPLCEARLSDLVCCPGGLELAGKSFAGRLGLVADWHRDRLREGMRGFVAYAEGVPRGFVEYAPADVAPFPIEAPGACVLLCFHWAGTQPEDPQHLAEERRMIEAATADARPAFAGMAALGWSHPTHYPIALLLGLGFREIVRDEPIALLWLPFQAGSATPTLARPTFRARDLGAHGVLAIDQAWSARCPYSIHFAERMRDVVSTHPDRESIDLRQVRIDTRDEAFRLAASPWDWGWTYLNAEEISLFQYGGDTLREEIARRVASLGDARAA
ncbi:MAG: hypothetical protein PHU43_01890 [Candidatus Bipolaricaulis sp.]|nr:hypothetical protein [Candidatus Bipolaricaulis sp.]